MSAKRTDSNQSSIVAGLRQFGATVVDLHTVGHGCPDIGVGFRGKTYLFEVKTADGRLTPDEQKFHNEWRGIIYTVRTIEQAIQILCDDCEE